MREPIVNIAVQAARAAGNLIIRAADRAGSVKVDQKKPNNYITDIDKLAEREIISIIRKAHPNHGILSKECGALAGNDIQWIIDPIDGNRNFIHGFPHFAVSIAISLKGVIQHGVIYDPTRQELFTASRGKGAQLNDHRLRVSKRSTLDECLLGTGFPNRLSPEEEQTAYLSAFQELVPLCGDIRRSGAACLDLAYVAAGRLDGYWELGLKSWDISAGALMIKEAGGIICDLNGSEDYIKTGHVVAGNPKALKLLLKSIRPHLLAIL